MQEVAAIGVRDSSNVPFSPHQLMTYSHGFHLFIYFVLSILLPEKKKKKKKNFLFLISFLQQPQQPQDSHLLATNSRAKQSLFSVDLERPDIVEEWSTGTFDVDQVFFFFFFFLTIIIFSFFSPNFFPQVYQKSKFNEDERVISVLNEQGPPSPPPSPSPSLTPPSPSPLLL